MELGASRGEVCFVQESQMEGKIAAKEILGALCSTALGDWLASFLGVRVVDCLIDR